MSAAEWQEAAVFWTALAEWIDSGQTRAYVLTRHANLPGRLVELCVSERDAIVLVVRAANMQRLVAEARRHLTENPL